MVPGVHTRREACMRRDVSPKEGFPLRRGFPLSLGYTRGYERVKTVIPSYSWLFPG